VVGFSLNFWMALFGRMLGGALNGNVGVIQTMVGELVVNPKHERKSEVFQIKIYIGGTDFEQRKHTQSCPSCGL
jgi:hypothetical protein